MSVPAFTPGPYHTKAHPLGVMIVDAEGRAVARAYGSSTDPLRWPVAANAQLLAASPKMHAALVAVSDVIAAVLPIDLASAGVTPELARMLGEAHGLVLVALAEAVRE